MFREMTQEELKHQHKLQRKNQLKTSNIADDEEMIKYLEMAMKKENDLDDF